MNLAIHSLLFISAVLALLGQSAGDDEDCQAVFEVGDGGDQGGLSSSSNNGSASSAMPQAGATSSSAPQANGTAASPITSSKYEYVVSPL